MADQTPRRLVLTGLAAATLSPLTALSQPPAGPPPGGRGGGRGGPPPGAGRGGRGPAAPPSPEAMAAALPLKTRGLEHFGTLVPDVAAAGAFYGKVFNPALHKERADPLRYYVPFRLGPTTPPLHYMAIGAANGRTTQIDHYAVLAEGYNAAAVAARLAQEASPPAAGRFGMLPDPDGVQLQIMGGLGGLAASTEPAPPVSAEPPIVTPMGMDNFIIHVADLEKAIPYYQKFFSGRLTRAGDRAWIQIEDTRLGIQKAPAGEAPKIASFGVKVARFDRADVARKLQALGATMIPTSGEDREVLRFRSPMGFVTDLRGV